MSEYFNIRGLHNAHGEASDEYTENMEFNLWFNTHVINKRLPANEVQAVVKGIMKCPGYDRATKLAYIMNMFMVIRDEDYPEVYKVQLSHPAWYEVKETLEKGGEKKFAKWLKSDDGEIFREWMCFIETLPE